MKAGSYRSWWSALSFAMQRDGAALFGKQIGMSHRYIHSTRSFGVALWSRDILFLASVKDTQWAEVAELVGEK